MDINEQIAAAQDEVKRLIKKKHKMEYPFQPFKYVTLSHNQRNDSWYIRNKISGPTNKQDTFIVLPQLKDYEPELFGSRLAEALDNLLSSICDKQDG